MPDTTCHMSISLDGFVAGPDQSRDNPLGKRGIEVHRWHLGDERANDADATAEGWLMRPRGAYVMGRNMFGPVRGAVLEREPITEGNLDEAMDGPAISDEEHEVTLSEEEVVVEKKAVPKERVRLDKETEVTEERVTEEVRKEQIEAEGDIRR
jgi:uncharacterized protein (TIGR02271 family)